MQPTEALRHPLDPDPVRSSKAGAVFGLGLLAAVTGVLVGGVVPATIALLLARQARREAYASGGFLTGSSWVRRGERLAWIGIMLCVATVVVATVIGILKSAGPGGVQDFAPGVD
ncbi:hypothetical protein AB0J82_06890 [Asanoa sp. NPDC049518]|uniref:hypothetical protein n=1 Tax=unclassified Asanoa TaxID=2685164 RepID=UPI003449AC14